MSRYPMPFAPGPLWACILGLAVAVVGVYAWVFYVTDHVTNLGDLVHDAQNDDSRQDVQLGSVKATVAEDRNRIDALDIRIEHLVREQLYLREVGRHTISSMGVLNERLRVAVERQDRVTDAIAGRMRATMPPPPPLVGFDNLPPPEDQRNERN